MPILTLSTIANINPYTNAAIFKKEISFSTQDEITGQSISEGYNVNGPFNTTITAISLAGGTKFVVPITTDTGSGAPFLKFHFPNGTSSNKMFVTFAVKNSRMADGYYDYITGIPATYRNQLKNFIVSPISVGQLSSINGPREKAIRFTTYGSSTNKPAESVTFYVTFKAVFTPNTASASPAGVNLATPTTGISGTGIAITGFPGVVATK